MNVTVESSGALAPLRSVLAHELGAVAAYKQAIAHLHDHDGVHGALEAAREAHEARAQRLRKHVEDLGGSAPDRPSMLGHLAAVVEAGATRVSPIAAVAMLEQWEDRGIKTYRRALGALAVDSELRRLVEDDLLPAQIASHRAVCALKGALEP